MPLDDPYFIRTFALHALYDLVSRLRYFYYYRLFSVFCCDLVKENHTN